MTHTTAPSAEPRRKDYDNLIVLYLYGSYREMGRQQVELLGELADEIYDVQREDWARLIAGFGLAAKLLDMLLPPFWMWAGPRYESSGYYDEIRGIADALGVSAGDGWRGVLGVLGSGTTTFVATASATADGLPIVGKNSDWSDSDGMRRPVVCHYYPSNGDLPHIMATWPLLGFPVMGVNEAGLALGVNFFNADQILGLWLPQWSFRRALQKATTVKEGVGIITQARTRGISGFVSMADADGDIALVECTPKRHAVFGPQEDWFAQSNHARTEKMVPRDRGRSEGSFRRRAAMETAVQRHLGRITPQVAATILRDRSNSPYVNESTVANTSVLNSTVVHPATRTLWHSTAKQPQAPFGEMIAFSLDPDDAGTSSIPADPRLGMPEMEREGSVISEAREAVRLFNDGEFEKAAAIWDRFADNGERLLEPHTLAWARARARWTLGNLEEAEALLSGLDTDDAPFDVRAHALVARAVISDRTGRRADALTLYGQAQAYLDSHPEYYDQLTVIPLRSRIRAGLKAPLASGAMPETPDLQRLP